MWKAKFFLVLVVLMNLSSATTIAPKAATKGKASALKEQQKEPKEKRDTPSSAPYSYEVPQRQFHAPVHVNQQKHTSIEHLIPQNKVAALEYLPKHEAPKQQYHEQQQYHPTSFVAPMAPVENLFNDHPVKEIEDYSFGYPHYESYAQFPGLYYNGEYDKVIAVPLSALQGYKSSPNYYQAPAASYSYPQHSYSMPNYAPSIPAHYSSSFTQSPASLFIPQTVSIPSKPHGKVPDYAQGSKGLSHFSTVASLQPISSSYKQNSYDVPSYSFTQTERPFKPSAFLGASMVHHEQHETYAPSKSYLPPSSPPKEPQYHKPQYVAAEPHYHQQQYAAKAPAIDYEIHYVQYPVGKSYLPQAPAQNAYLPSKQVSIEPPKSSYLPPAPSAAPPAKTYLPQAPIVKLEKPKSSYLPPTNTYLPPNNPFASAAHHHHYQQQQQQPQYSSQQYSSQSQSHEAYDSQEYSQSLLGHK